MQRAPSGRGRRRALHPVLLLESDHVWYAAFGRAGAAGRQRIFRSRRVRLGGGAAFARAAIKNVRKRDFMIEIERDSAEVANKIVGSEIRGEAVLRNLHGNEMQFPSYS